MQCNFLKEHCRDAGGKSGFSAGNLRACACWFPASPRAAGGAEDKGRPGARQGNNEGSPIAAKAWIALEQPPGNVNLRGSDLPSPLDALCRTLMRGGAAAGTRTCLEDRSQPFGRCTGHAGNIRCWRGGVWISWGLSDCKMSRRAVFVGRRGVLRQMSHTSVCLFARVSIFVRCVLLCVSCVSAYVLLRVPSFRDGVASSAEAPRRLCSQVRQG